MTVDAGPRVGISGGKRKCNEQDDQSTELHARRLRPP
jgi:hypothetical protein